MKEECKETGELQGHLDNFVNLSPAEQAGFDINFLLYTPTPLFVQGLFSLHCSCSVIQTHYHGRQRQIEMWER